MGLHECWIVEEGIGRCMAYKWSIDTMGNDRMQIMCEMMSVVDHFFRQDVMFEVKIGCDDDLGYVEDVCRMYGVNIGEIEVSLVVLFILGWG